MRFSSVRRTSSSIALFCLLVVLALGALQLVLHDLDALQDARSVGLASAFHELLDHDAVVEDALLELGHVHVERELARLHVNLEKLLLEPERIEAITVLGGLLALEIR
jgi:hypothetical protein